MSKDFIHYGSLDTQLVQNNSDELDEARESGNVNISQNGAETLALSKASLLEQEKHAQAIQEIVAKKRERTILVPTDDDATKAQLRELGEPICLFGEREGERRSRLRKLLAKQQVAEEEVSELQERLDNATREFKRQKLGKAEDSDNEIESLERKREKEKAEKERKETFYIPAGEDLIRFRKETALYSWRAAQNRLGKQRALFDDVDEVLSREEQILEVHERVQETTVVGSQIGDKRPLSCCGFNSSGSFVGTGSFSGIAKVWDSETFNCLYRLGGHEDRCVSLDFSPSDTQLLVTGSADNTVKLWRIPNDETSSEIPVAKEAGSNMMDDSSEKEVFAGAKLTSSLSMTGHALRLSSVSWHRMGRHVGSSSYDHTWRLWDVETGTELLLQEGHEYPVYGLSLNHPDGSLAFSGDLAGIGRLWDLRSGKSIHNLMGHVSGILCADFSISGYHLATGSLDHTARIWDLRQRKVQHIIPGHQSLVSQVSFCPETGSFLLTSSHDYTCKLWAAREILPLCTLKGHDHLVTDSAISSSGKILSCSYDKTWKLWSPADSGMEFS